MWKKIREFFCFHRYAHTLESRHPNGRSFNDLNESKYGHLDNFMVVKTCVKCGKRIEE